MWRQAHVTVSVTRVINSLTHSDILMKEAAINNRARTMRINWSPPSCSAYHFSILIKSI
jgi:hypothetical protein